MNDEILTPADVSVLLKLHLKTVYKLTHAGKIPAFRIGRSWRYRKSEITGLVTRPEVEEVTAA